MQSSSSSSSKPRIEKLLSLPREYIRDSFMNREQLEENELRDNLKDFYVSVSKASNNKDDNNQKLKVKNKTVQMKTIKSEDWKNGGY
jgi:hypothetical protein